MKIKKGELIIFPTDTVYGLGAKIDDEIAQEKIYKIKEREKSKRLACLVANIGQAMKYVHVTEDAKRLMNAFWPGALTIILFLKKDVGKLKKGDTLAVRMPNHNIAINILLENGPMATTSVNISGEAPLNDKDEIIKFFKDKVDYIITEEDNNYLNVSSTVIDLTNRPYQVYREGTVTKNQIMEIIGI